MRITALHRLIVNKLLFSLPTTLYQYLPVLRRIIMFFDTYFQKSVLEDLINIYNTLVHNSSVTYNIQKKFTAHNDVVI